jgi:hypothetical protein
MLYNKPLDYRDYQDFFNEGAKKGVQWNGINGDKISYTYNGIDGELGLSGYENGGGWQQSGDAAWNWLPQNTPHSDYQVGYVGYNPNLNVPQQNTTVLNGYSQSDLANLGGITGLDEAGINNLIASGMTPEQIIAQYSSTLGTGTGTGTDKDTGTGTDKDINTSTGTDKDTGTGLTYTPPDYSAKVQGIYDPLKQKQTTLYQGGLAAIKSAFDKVVNGLNNQAPIIEQQAAEAMNQNDIGYYQGKQNLAAAMEAAGQKGGENITGNVGLSAMRGTGQNQINQIKANNLKAISDAVNQAMADQAAQESGLTTQYQGDMAMIDSEQAKAIQDAEQQGVVNAINLAGILGTYQDPTSGIKTPTMELQKFQYGQTQDTFNNAINEANVTGVYKGNPTQQKQQTDYNNTYQEGRDTIDDNRYTEETKYNKEQDTIQNNRLAEQDKIAALEKEKEEFIATIGQYSDYQAQIDKISNDNDTSNDWQLPYLKAARAEKVAAQEAAKATAAAKTIADQNAQSKAMYDAAFDRWKTAGKVLTQADADILGVPVGSPTEAYAQAQMSNTVAQQNADTAKQNADTASAKAADNGQPSASDQNNYYNGWISEAQGEDGEALYKDLQNNKDAYIKEMGQANYNKAVAKAQDIYYSTLVDRWRGNYDYMTSILSGNPTYYKAVLGLERYNTLMKMHD